MPNCSLGTANARNQLCARSTKPSASRLARTAVSGEDREWVDQVAELAFRMAFDASEGHHDLAAQVSDDVRLLAEASLVGYQSSVLEAMWAIYAAGAFPVALQETRRRMGEWTI